MISNAETVKANEYLRRKKLRLQQVREQSKNIAQKLRTKIVEEKSKKVDTINAARRNLHEGNSSRNIETLRSQHQGQLLQLGEGHLQVANEERDQQEWIAQKEYSRSKSAERGAKAISFLQKQRAQERQTLQRAADTRQAARKIRDVPISKTSVPRRLGSQGKIQESYTEGNTPEAECSNAFNKNDEINLQKYEITGTTPAQKLSNRDNDLPQENRETNESDFRKKANHPSSYRVIPVETLRQIESNIKHVEPEITNKDAEKNLFPTYSVSSYMNSRHKDPIDKPFCNVISEDNAFNIVHQHIQSRSVGATDAGAGVTKNLDADDAEKLHDVSNIRHLIQQTRHAPYKDLRVPSIPSLPEHYRKTDENPLDTLKYARRKSHSDLAPVYDEQILRNRSLPSHTKFNTHKCQRLKSAGVSKPLRSILIATKYSTLRGCRNVKCCPGKSPARFSPTTRKFCSAKTDIMPNCLTGDGSRTARSVGCYDQPNKFSNQRMYERNEVVERLPRGGKNAFQSALDEIEDEDLIAARSRAGNRDTIRRIRGEVAIERLRSDREGRSAEMEEDDCEREVNFAANKNVQPRRTERMIQRKLNDGLRHEAEKHPADMKQTGKSGRGKTASPSKAKPHKKRSEIQQEEDRSSVVSSIFDVEELDKIPTRDSGTSLKSTRPDTHKSLGSKTSQDKLNNLLQKHKRELTKELLKEFSKMVAKDLNRSEDRKAVSSISDRAESINSSPQETERERVIEKQPSSPRIVKTAPSEVFKNRDGAVTVTKSSPAIIKCHPSSSTTSLVSFEGLQIVIEVKKNNKKITEQTEDDTERQFGAKQEIDSSSEMSITTSKYVTKKQVRVEKGSKHSGFKFDSSESTAYMSPPEKISTQFEKNLDSNFPVKNGNYLSRGVQSSTEELPLRNLNENKVREWVATSVSGTPEPNKKNVHNRNVTRLSNDILKTTEISGRRETSVSKGVQVSSLIMSRKTQQTVTSETTNPIKVSEKMDPILKKHIIKLLNISRTEIDHLAVSSSDVSTPGSSVINVSSNVTKKPMNDILNKLERLQQFIQENYTLLEELSKDSLLTSNANNRFKNPSKMSLSDLPSSSVDASSVNTKKAKDSSDHNNFTGNICQVFPQKNIFQPQAGHKSPRKSKPGTETKVKSANRNISYKSKFGRRFSKLSPIRVEKGNDEHLKVVTESVAGQSNSVANEMIKNPLITQDALHKIASIDLIDDVDEAIPDSHKESPSDLDDRENQDLVLNLLSDADNDIDHGNVKPAEITDTTGRRDSELKRLENIKQLKWLSEQCEMECEEKISSLSQMLERVRREKRVVLSLSGSDSDTTARSLECVNQVSSIQKPEDSRAIGDLQFTPIMSDIPKPYATKDNDIKPTECFINRELSAGDGVAIPAFTDNGQFQHFLDFDGLETMVSSVRPKPPVALMRNPIIKANVDIGTPHELSTIAEVDTPKTTNVSGLSKNLEVSPKSCVSLKLPVELDDEDKHGGDVTAKSLLIESAFNRIEALKDLPKIVDEKNVLNLSVPNLDQSINTECQRLVTLREFIQKHNAVEPDERDTTLVFLEDDDERSAATKDSSSEETLPDIILEMIKRDLIKKPFSSNNSTTHGSGEESSSSSIKDLNESFKASKHKRRIDVPSVSGVHPLLNSSSSSNSLRSTADLESALKNAKMGWALSTLRKTQEAAALSSSSSSLKSRRREKSVEDLRSSQRTKNMSKLSIGLSTLVDDLNFSDMLLKEYADDNLTRNTLMKDLDLLWNEIHNDKKNAAKSKENVLDVQDMLKKARSGKTEGEKNKNDNSLAGEVQASTGKDKTQHRTSTPVQAGKSDSSDAASSSHQTSNGLFSIESDLSSVKNISDKNNYSSSDREGLSVPNMTLKFGKLFDSTTLSER